MTFSEKMLLTLKKYSMLNVGDKVLVALSGGADSVSLLLGLLEIKDIFNLQIEAAHVNHLLRGQDSEHDMNFVESLCQKLGIKLYVLKKDIKEYSKIHKCSCEDAGRRVRYEFISTINADKIATAHTKDDNGENFFISALRGTRIMGIPPVRGKIIRPLINIQKSEIYEYLKEKNQDFCVDKTNFSDDYFRNKVRLNLIPYINKEFKIDIADSLENNLDIIYEESCFINSEAEKFIENYCEIKQSKITAELNDFNKLHTALKRRILRNLYYKITDSGYISYIHADSIIRLAKDGKTGKKLPLCKNTEAEISYGKLIIKKSENISGYLYTMKLEDSLEIDEAQIKLTLSCKKQGIDFFYSDETEFSVRTRQNGDRLSLKNKHHKKLSDFFTDKKIPLDFRDKMPIVCDSLGICAVENLYLRKEKKENKVYIHIERIK